MAIMKGMIQTRHQIVIACVICVLSLTHGGQNSTTPAGPYTNGVCPPRTWSPPECDRPCECDWNNTLYCDPRNSRCVCQDGYENVRCNDDIDECLLGDGLCPEREYCENTNGSYDCICVRGFLRSSITDRCEPCAGPLHGDTCPFKCKCHPRNAIMCEQMQGWCMCRRGWEGEACEKNIDDCRGVVCPTGVCQDALDRYFCRCVLGQRKIRGKCLAYRTDFVASNHNPDIGELVDIFIVFHLPALYHANLHFGDDFDSTMTGGESWDRCVVSLHKHNEIVYGYEDFFKYISKDQPGHVEYQYYSSYKVRFLTEGQKTLTIKPYSETTQTLKLNFNVQYKSLSVRNCFGNMTINGTSPYPDEPNVNHTMKRQDYKTLRVDYNVSGLCSDVPRFQWQYYKVDERAFTDKINDLRKYCMFAKYFQPLDIINLAYLSGDTEISDHMSQTDVIQKNTLPLGPVLVCVAAYIKNDQRSSATTCGFIKVEHSGLILGSIVPRLYKKSIGSNPRFYLKSHFWDPDDPSYKLKYRWRCFTRNQLTGRYKAYNNWCFQAWQMRKANITPAYAGFVNEGYFQVTVTNGYRNRVTAKLHIERKYQSRRENELKISCRKSCEEEIDATSALHLKVKRPSRWVKWSITANGSWISGYNKYIKDYHRQNFKLNKGQRFLQENTEYTIFAEIQGSDVYAEYRFRTKKAQTVGQCLLKPNSGNLVTDRFTFQCSGYKDPYDSPKTYRLFQKYEVYYDREKRWLSKEALIGYSGTNSIPELTLSHFKDGDVLGGEQVWVKLRWEVWSRNILAFKSPTSDYNLTIPPTLNVSDVLDTDMNKHRKSNFQENLRRNKDIATMINMEWKTNITQMNYAFIRQQLLQNMNNNKKPMSLSAIRLKTFAMQAILEREDEIIEQGLEDGLDTLTFLVKQLERFPKNVLEQLYLVHLQCLDRLSTVLHDVAMRLHKDPAKVNKRDIRKNKKESIRLTEAVEHICQIIAWSIKDTTTITPQFSSYNMGIQAKQLTFSYDGRRFFMVLHQVRINLQDATIVLNKQRLTEPEVLMVIRYKKSPYAWAADKVLGSLPLTDVRLFTPEKDKETVKESRKFNPPLSILTELKAHPAKGTEIPLNLVVNALSKNIVHSSCVTMKVTPSITENTVLEVISSDKLIMRVQFALTMSSKLFEGQVDEDMIEMPLKQGKNQYDFDYLRLRRPKNTLVLPRISSRKILGDDENYRVRITIKKGQTVQTAKHQSTPDKILQTLLQANITELYTTKVTVAAYTMSCKHVNQIDLTFGTDVCRMKEFSHPSQHLVCFCTKSGGLTGSVLANQSLITLVGATSVAEVVIKDFHNPLVSFMVAATWIIFLVALFWAKRKDKLDGLKNKVKILEDNEEGDKHVYLVCFSTGTAMTSAPSADVFMYFRGTNSSTRPHVFWDRQKVTFEPGTEDWFVMTTSDDIGDVTSAVVWTVQKGGEKDQSWNLVTVFIENMLTEKAWVCRYNAWISISPDGQDVVEIPASHEATLTKDKRAQLIQRCKHDLRTNNLWFGLIGKTPYDTYSRVRRLTTALTVVISLLFFNLALFDMYKVTTRYILHPLNKIHSDSVQIGLISSIVSTLMGLVVSFLFNRIKPWPTKDYLKKSKDGAGSSPLQNGRDTGANSGINRTMNHLDVSQNAAEIGEAPQSEESSEKGVRRRIASDVLSVENEGKDKKKSVFADDKSGKQSSKSSSSTQSSSSSSSSSSNAKSKFEEAKKMSAPQPKKQSIKDFFVDFGGAIAQSIKRPHPRLAKIRKDLQTKWEVLRSQRTYDPIEINQFRKEPFSLPSWFIVVIWPVVVAYNIFLSYFAILYGPSVSFNRSLDWLVAFFTGLLTDILVYQPLVTICFSYILVHFFRRPYTFRTRAPLQCLKETRNLIKSHFMTRKPEGPESKTQAVRGNVHIRGSQSVAKDIMRRLHLEGIAREILRDLVLYSLFVASALYLINQDLKTTPRYWITYNLKRTFLRTLNLDQGMKISAVWDYFVDIVIPMLNPTKAGTIQIENTYLFGTTRLRQVRIVEDEGICVDLMEQLVAYYSGYLCAHSYPEGREDQWTYYDSWYNPFSNTTKTNVTTSSDSPFQYWSAEALEHSYYHRGDHGYYSAGGYIKLITPDVPHAVAAALRDLDNRGWIDQLTRCLFIEFTLYNANENIISGVRIAFEFVNYGAVFPTVSFDSSSFLSQNTWQANVAEVIICICVLYYTYDAYRDMREEGVTIYLSSVWNIMEVSVLILSVTSVAFVYRRHQVQLEVTDKYKEHGNSRYTDFSKLFDLGDIVEQLLGCLGALIILKTLKLITFNPFMAKFTKTIEISAPNLAGYLVLTVIYTVAFSATGVILFGTMMMEYSIIRYSMFAHIRFILGGPDLQSMFAADWILGRVFAMLGLGITQYIVLNIFISILRESFGLAHQMTYRDEETTVMYVKNMALRYMGISQKR